MTTPGGVPNLPPGALTLDTLASDTQDVSVPAMKSRAAGRFSSIFASSTGLSPASNFTPFGILTSIFAGFNSTVANADPADVDGPEDLPGLLIDFIESLPFVGQFVGLLEAILGTYDGDDATLLTVQNIFAPIRAIVDAITSVAGGDFANFFNLGGSTSILGAITTPITNLAQNIFAGLTGGIFGGSGGTNGLFVGIQNALRNINPLNVNGVGGPSTIFSTVTTFLNQLVGGFVGSVGSDAGFADVFNVGQQVSSNSTLGKFSFDILGIRNNKSLLRGFFPTSNSTVSLDRVALQSSAPTFAVTQSTAITGYQRVDESGQVGFVSWLGSGTTSITTAFINIFKMDPTTGLSTLVHASSNIVGLMSNSMQHNVYSLPAAITAAPGDILGVELAVTGAGTHSMVGMPTWLPAHPAVFPQKLSAVRNSGVSSPPSTIAHSSLTYASNVPVFEFGTSTGTVSIPHTAETNLFNAAGSMSIPIPDWANFVDAIVVGAGGAGHVGGTWGVSGRGGDEGAWSTGTWARGTDFTGTPSISITVGAGGAGGSGNGSNGGNSSAAITGHTVTGNGGAGATAYGVISSDQSGDSPGNQTYNSIVYVGGGTQGTAGGNGAAPGGGGAGGNYISFQHGGNGAPGSVWIVFRQ